MARSEIDTEFNTFVGGILTEANPINYPVGFSLEHENFIAERNGTLRRRVGLDYDSATTNAAAWTTNSKTDLKVVTTWLDAGSSNTANDTKDLLLLGEGNTVRAYDLSDKDAIADNFVASFSGTSGTYDASVTTMTVYRDRLVVTWAQSERDITLPVEGVQTYYTIQVGVYSFDQTSDTFTEESLETIKVRDFVGIPNDDALDFRSTSLVARRYYNLLNNGWITTNISQFFTDTATYPAISDNMNTGLDAETGVFTSTWVQKANNGINASTRGRYFVDVAAPNWDREFVLEDEGGLNYEIGTPTLTSSFVKSAVEFQGRMFYLISNKKKHLHSSNFGTSLLAFSTSSGDAEVNATQCGSINDPTARDFNVPLDTDGGLLDLSLIGDAIEIVALKSRIIIFGSKGVFELFSLGDTFRPSTLSIRKISSNNCIGIRQPVFTTDDSFLFSNHIVVANESVFYISDEGINELLFDPNSEQFTNRIASSKIKTLVNSIPVKSKALARGVYSGTDLTVRWLYSAEDPDTYATDNVSGSKDTELVYDLVLQAWYQNTFPSTTALTDNPSLERPLLINTGDISQSSYPVDSTLRYLAAGTYSQTLPAGLKVLKFDESEFNDYTVATGTGIDTPAVIQTGYLNANDSARQKQSAYIVPSFLRTEDGFTDDGSGNLTPTNESSCLISAWWDYVDDASLPKANDTFEAYKYNRLYIPSGPADTFDYGQRIITTKNRLTGRGRALSLRFETSAGKDCRLLGWNLNFSQGTKV
jgi:hypothetical protein